MLAKCPRTGPTECPSPREPPGSSNHWAQFPGVPTLQRAEQSCSFKDFTTFSEKHRAGGGWCRRRSLSQGWESPVSSAGWFAGWDCWWLGNGLGKSKIKEDHKYLNSWFFNPIRNKITKTIYICLNLLYRYTEGLLQSHWCTEEHSVPLLFSPLFF